MNEIKFQNENLCLEWLLLHAYAAGACFCTFMERGMIKNPVCARGLFDGKCYMDLGTGVGNGYV